MVYLAPHKLELSRSEIRENIEVTGNPNYWNNIQGTNCYAYALGLDINEKRIAKCAYQPGVMGSIMLHKPIVNIKNMTIEERMILDLKALKIYCKEIEVEESELKFCSKRTENDNSITTYYWPVAIFEDINSDNFHFMRLTSDGTWYHKFGYFSSPHNYDEDKRIITDPRECNLNNLKYKKTYQLICNQKY